MLFKKITLFIQVDSPRRQIMPPTKCKFAPGFVHIELFPKGFYRMYIDIDIGHNVSDGLSSLFDFIRSPPILSANLSIGPSHCTFIYGSVFKTHALSFILEN